MPGTKRSVLPARCRGGSRSAPGDQRTPLAAMSAAVLAALPTLLFLLGLAAADESWSWLDGSVAEYVRWGNESTNIGENCSILLASSEMWTKVKCDQGHGRVVCKVPMGTNYRGVAIAIVVITFLAFVCVLIWHIYQKKRFHWAGFSLVRFDHRVNEDEIALPSFHD